ncbi:PQQ-binding-like beta-propeller repeat protein [uncultured Chryseobacterium sp.]|uniref:outer membrane protein assembly factor BamB family protein n=1 Tax=uncultured Chryseobacterium sp. TaxID=259322 RepID=UPI0025E9A0D3|nr:PQQ-binding-like beta-propeller repeat protein [uncultured Chryseobacterium sp.]
MSRILIPLFFLLLFSCKKTEYHDGKNRYATVATINSKDSLLAYSYTKGSNYEIKLEDLRTYKTIYSKKISNNCFTEPRTQNGKLYFPESDHLFTGVDYKTGKISWKLPPPGRIREFQIVNNHIIIASIDLYGIMAIHAHTGKILYELPLHSDKNCQVDFAPCPIGFDETYFYVSNFNCSLISAYEISSGKKVWSKTESASALSNFTVAGKYIFLGYNLHNNDNLSGEIMLLEAHTGKLLYRQFALFDIFTDPVPYGNKMYYHTYDYRLQELDVENKTERTLFTFEKSNDFGGNQIYRQDHFLFLQDIQYNILKIDLHTFKKEIFEKGNKGMLGVYKLKDKINLIY